MTEQFENLKNRIQHLIDKYNEENDIKKISEEMNLFKNDIYKYTMDNIEKYSLNIINEKESVLTLKQLRSFVESKKKCCNENIYDYILNILSRTLEILVKKIDEIKEIEFYSKTKKLREDSKNLNANIIDYLKAQNSYKTMRAVGVITEKQLCFCCDTEFKYRMHDEILIYILNKLYPNISNNNELFQIGYNHVILIADSLDLFVYLPDNDNFSNNQYLILENIINQIYQFNSEYSEKEQIHFIDKNLSEKLEKNNLLELLKSKIVETKKENNDIIYGKTLKKIKDENNKTSF